MKRNEKLDIFHETLKDKQKIGEEAFTLGYKDAGCR